MVVLRSAQATAVDAALYIGTPDDDPPFPFLRLPLELRDYIYRMLLTTKYAYIEAGLSDKVNYPCKRRFDLRPSILLANKQISMEAKRVLYMENEFVIFKCYGSNETKSLWNDFIATFHRLSEEKMPNPKLRITIEPMAAIEESRRDSWSTIITTVEGIPNIFSAIWKIAPAFGWYDSMSLALDLHNDARFKRHHMREQFMTPWKLLQGFGKVFLAGDLSEHVVQDIKESIAQGPRPDELVNYLKQFNGKAELCFGRGDFAAARYQWVSMQEYWWFYFSMDNIRRTRAGGPAHSRGDIPTTTTEIVTRARFRVVLLHITNQDYKRAQIDVECVLRGRHMTREDHLEPIFKAKAQLCRLFSMAAFCSDLQGHQLEALDDVVVSLRQSTLFADTEFEQLRNEVRLGINNSLINLGSRHRCCRAELACPKLEGGRAWKVQPGCRSFWDWLEVPEQHLRSGSSNW